MTYDGDISEVLEGLSDAELLKALNTALAKRATPPTEAELAQQQARAADAEYAAFYPTGR